MVELQIVILAVAGSSPVGHPPPRPARSATLHHHVIDGTTRANQFLVINPTVRPTTFETVSASFWQRFINDSALQDCDPLEKLVAGCELIAAVDDLDLLAA